MSDIDKALNMEYIRNVHGDALTELESKVTAHKNSGNTAWESVENAHSTRYANIDAKVVNVDG